jgi:hypothetical protein
MDRITIHLTSSEKNTLLKFSERNCRDPRMQVWLIICFELVRRGLLVEKSVQAKRKRHTVNLETNPHSPV